MTGGDGDDVYVVDSAFDTVTETNADSVTGGVDEVEASVSFTLGNNVEDLTLTSTAALNGTGNALANTITGNDGNNVLTGLAGDDVLAGGVGDDTLSGGLGADEMTGGTGNDSLDGGAGADSMDGGAGDDTYVVDNASETGPLLADSGGTDLVESSVSFTLAAGFDNLTLTGTANINGEGFGGEDNILTGNSGANKLTGNTGDTDELIGGAGNDSYYVNGADNVTTEDEGGGTDLVVVDGLDWTLSDNIENLTLESAGTGTGNELANTITGSTGNDSLVGAAGSDVLIGGGGVDVYNVDTATDVVTDAEANDGDTVESSISWTLGTNLENLDLSAATGAVNGTGNTLDNEITGNDAANILDGGTDGTDVLTGAAGNDTYVVSHDGVEIDESGTSVDVDLVQSSITLDLGDKTVFTGNQDVENLTLTGTADIDGTGNDADNVLVGNTGANALDGGLGDDTMEGGLGDDTYTVDSTKDVITEAANGGVDVVVSEASWTLGANLENLDLSNATAGVTGTGNTLNNSITGSGFNDIVIANAGDDTVEGGVGDDTISGNAGLDSLVGGDGDDILTGGAGVDTLDGGLGDDDYYTGNDDGASDVIKFGSGDGDDVIYGFASTQTAADTILMGSGIGAADISATQVGMDLVLEISSGDTLTINRFFEWDESNQFTVGSITFTDSGEPAMTLDDIMGLL
jgi:Ca2+-binding RTX toxin-like protein